MDSVLIAFVLNQVPSLVAAHPREAMAVAFAVLALEHAWPHLPIKGNSTVTVLFHALAAGLKAVLPKKG